MPAALMRSARPVLSSSSAFYRPAESTGSWGAGLTGFVITISKPSKPEMLFRYHQHGFVIVSISLIHRPVQQVCSWPRYSEVPE
jgi:hypothetical protein